MRTPESTAACRERNVEAVDRGIIDRFIKVVELVTG
jgi:hypothetical protein